MALPQFHDVLADPKFRDSPVARKKEINNAYWTAYGKENPDDAWGKQASQDAASALDASEQLETAAPVARRALELQKDAANTRLKIGLADKQGLWSTPEERTAFIEQKQADVTQRQEGLKKTFSLFQPEVEKQMAPAWEALTKSALEGGVFGERSIRASNMSGPMGNALAGQEAQGAVEGRKKYEGYRDTLAKDFNLAPEEVDDLVKHRMGAQKDPISRDALGGLHIKDELLMRGNDELQKSIAESKLPDSVKSDLSIEAPQRIAAFKAGVIENTKKQHPEFSSSIDWTGDVGKDFAAINRRLTDTASGQAGGGFGQYFEKRAGQAFNVIGLFADKFTERVFNKESDISKAGDIISEQAKFQESTNQLSNFINQEKVRILGVDAATVGAGVASGVESVAIGAVTGGLGTAIISAERIKKAGTVGKILLGGAQRGLNTAPIASIYGLEQGIETYERTGDVGLSLLSAAIEGGVTTVFGAVKLGGTEDLGQRLANPAVRAALGKSVAKSWASFGYDVGKTITEEQLEELSITTLNNLYVESKLNPGMTTADMKKAWLDTAVSTLFASGPLGAITGASEQGSNLFKSTAELTDDQLHRNADDIYKAAAKENIPQAEATGGAVKAPSPERMAPTVSMSREELVAAIEQKRAAIEGASAGNAEIKLPDGTVVPAVEARGRTAEERRALEVLKGTPEEVAAAFGVEIIEPSQESPVAAAEPGGNVAAEAALDPNLPPSPNKDVPTESLPADAPPSKEGGVAAERRVIKLGSVDPRYRAAAEDIREQMGETVGFDENERRIVTPEGVQLEISSFGNSISLDSIVTPSDDRGQGLATKAMRDLVKLADVNNVKIKLGAKPFGSDGKKMTQSQLVSWYQKFGFELQPDGETMIRPPQTNVQNTPQNTPTTPLQVPPVSTGTTAQPNTGTAGSNQKAATPAKAEAEGAVGLDSSLEEIAKAALENPNDVNAAMLVFAAAGLRPASVTGQVTTAAPMVQGELFQNPEAQGDPAAVSLVRSYKGSPPKGATRALIDYAGEPLLAQGDLGDLPPHTVRDIKEADQIIQERTGKNGKAKLGRVGFNAFLSKLWKRHHRGKPPGWHNFQAVRDIREMGKILSFEVAHALSKDGSGVDWYRAKIDGMYAELATEYPELGEDTEARFLFSIMLAVTSNGQTVYQNLEDTIALYERIRGTSRLPKDAKTSRSERGAAVQKAFREINSLLDENSWQDVRRELLEPLTVSELKKKYGRELTGELADHTVIGAMILGPKIGSFWGNLNGHFDSITMDLWFTRTMNRLSGDTATINPQTLGKLFRELQTFPNLPVDVKNDIKKYLKDLDNTEKSWVNVPSDIREQLEHLYGFAKKTYGQYTTSGFEDRSDFNKNIQKIVKELDGGEDTPDNGTHRKWMRSVVEAAQSELRKAGVKLTNADLQAILWFHEKDLYTRFGATSNRGERTDYTQAAAKLVGTPRSSTIGNASAGRQSDADETGLFRQEGLLDVPKETRKQMEARLLAEREASVEARAGAKGKPSTAEGTPTNLNEVREYLGKRIMKLAQALGVEIAPNYSGYTARYVVEGPQGKGYIKYNPREFIGVSPAEIDATFREELIHAASDRALQKRGQTWVQFYAGLGKLLTKEEKADIKKVYRSAKTDIDYATEYFRMGVQKLLYGTVTEAEARTKAFQKIMDLIKDVVDFFKRNKRTEGIYRQVFNDTVTMMKNGEAALEGRVLNQDAEGPKGTYTPKAAAKAAGVSRAVLGLLEGKSDTTTGVHEAGHAIEDFLVEIGEGDKAAALEAWAKENVGDDWRKKREYIARGFERFVINGVKTGNAAVDAAFARIAEIMLNIYKGVKGSSVDVEIPPHIEKIFSDLLSRGAAQEAAGQKPVVVPVDVKVTPAPKPTPKKPAKTLPDLPRPQSRSTSIKNAATDKYLVDNGMAPMLAPARQSNEDTWDMAMARVEANDQAGSNVVKGILNSERSVTDEVEEGVLLHEMAIRKARVARARNDVMAAHGNEDAVREAQNNLREAQSELTQAIIAAKLAGTAWGRIGQFRQRFIDQDFSLEAMEARFSAEINDGAPLSANQSKLIAELHKKVVAAEARTAEVEAEISIKQREVDALLKKLEEKKPRAAPVERKGLTERTVAKVPSARDLLAKLGYGRGQVLEQSDTLNQDPELPQEALEAFGSIAAAYILEGNSDQSAIELLADEFGPVVMDNDTFILAEARAQLAKTSAGSRAKTPTELYNLLDPENPEISNKLVFNMVRGYINEGVPKEKVLKKVLKQLQEKFPALTYDELSDIFTGYGKVKFPSQEEDLKSVRELRNIERIQRQIRELEAGNTPKKTGQQRDGATARIRELQKELKDAFKAAKITHRTNAAQLAGALDAIKTRLKNELEDLDRAIRTNTPINRKKTQLEYDQEIKDLQARRDARRKDYDKLFGVNRKAMSDSQRLKATIKSLNKRITEERDLAKKGLVDRIKNSSKPVTDTEVDRLRATLTALVEARAKARAALYPSTSEEDRAAKRAETASKRLVDYYQKVLAGTAPGKKAPVKFTPSVELAKLITLKEDLKAAVKAMRKAARFSLRKSPEERSRNAAIKALERSVKDLESRVLRGDLSPRTRAAKRTDLDAELLKRQKAAQDALKALRDAKLPSREERRENALIRATATRMKKLQARIDAGDYVKVERVPAVMSTKLAAARLAESKVKEEWNRGFFEKQLAERSFGTKTYDAFAELLNFSRTMKTIADVSAVLRQGLVTAISHPVLSAKAIPGMFLAGFSEVQHQRIKDQIENHPLFGLSQQAKLFIADTGLETSVAKIEEAFRGRWAKKVPGISSVVGFSERTYNAYLNQVRMAQFANMVEGFTGGKPTVKEAKVIANYVNRATGRGDLKNFESAAAGLAAAFFSPKFVVSRFQVLWGVIPTTFNVATGFQLIPKDIRRAKIATAKEYARLIVGISAVYSLAVLAKAGFGEDDEEWELDPRSSGFGRIKIGNTRIDPMGGLLQAATFAARMLPTPNNGVWRPHTKTGAGSVVSLWRSGFGKQSYVGVMGMFLRTKLSPVPASVINMAQGEDVIGQPVSWQSEAIGSVVPLVFGDVYDTLNENGVKGTPLAVAAMFGLGVQTRNDELELEQYLSTLIGVNPQEYQKKSGQTGDTLQLKLKP